MPVPNTDGIINKLVTVFAGLSARWITNGTLINPDSRLCPKERSVTGDNNRLLIIPPGRYAQGKVHSGDIF